MEGSCSRASKSWRWFGPGGKYQGGQPTERRGQLERDAGAWRGQGDRRVQKQAYDFEDLSPQDTIQSPGASASPLGQLVPRAGREGPVPAFRTLLPPGKMRGARNHRLGTPRPNCSSLCWCHHLPSPSHWPQNLPGPALHPQTPALSSPGSGEGRPPRVTPALKAETACEVKDSLAAAALPSAPSPGTHPLPV